MKTTISTVFFLLAVFLSGCGESLAGSRYTLKLPDIPQSWESVPGPPQWRLEWVNNEGKKETATTGENIIEVSLPQNSKSAVLAMPFWPEKGINPGVFKPAGAIFPFDLSGKTLKLSWQGGVEAVFFRELAAACATALGAGTSAAKRRPENFDWPRFRLLFCDPSVNAEILADPWLADWHSIAEKTVMSGFDKRRMVPEPRGTLKIPAGPGPWTGTSPYASPLFYDDNITSAGFPVRQAADTWVSSEGLLRCNSETWIFYKWGL